MRLARRVRSAVGRRPSATTRAAAQSLVTYRLEQSRSLTVLSPAAHAFGHSGGTRSNSAGSSTVEASHCSRGLATPCSHFLNHNRRILAPFPREGTFTVRSLLSGALSWLAVATIGLAPMLVYWLARVIGQALRRRARGPMAGSPSAETEEGEKRQLRAAPPG
jgi:hypothetical protein